MTYPKTPGWKDPQVSKENAEVLRVSGRAESVKGRVLTLYRSGFVGTATQASRELGVSLLTVRPRCTELVAENNLRHAGTTRDEHGKQHYILQAVERQGDLWEL